MSYVNDVLVMSVGGRVCTANLVNQQPKVPSPDTAFVTNYLINEGVTKSMAISVEDNMFLFIATTADKFEKVS